MSEITSKRIGELNGPWAILLKLVLVIVPVTITVAATATIFITTGHNNEHKALNQSISSINVTLAEFKQWRDIGPRFTPADAQALELRIKDWARTAMETMSLSMSKSSSDQFRQLSDKLDALTIKLNELTLQIAKGQNKP